VVRLTGTKAQISGYMSCRVEALRRWGKRHVPLQAGTLVLIEHGDRHEIRNNGRAPLKTLNFYVPPAYTKSGDELPRAKA
jgi:mannose-6-phosphate isomerase-like protein (cupin superfamily)